MNTALHLVPFPSLAMSFQYPVLCLINRVNSSSIRADGYFLYQKQGVQCPFNQCTLNLIHLKVIILFRLSYKCAFVKQLDQLCVL